MIQNDIESKLKEEARKRAAEEARKREEARKARIRSEINALNGKIGGYNSLKSSLTSIVSDLGDTEMHLKDCYTTLSSSYLVDGIVVDSGKLTKSAGECSSISSKINNSIIPVINNKIKDFASRISVLQRSL